MTVPSGKEGCEDRATIDLLVARSKPLRATTKAIASGITKRLWSGAASRDPQPVAVGILEIALPSGKPLFIDGDPELLRYGVDVFHVQMDQRATRSVTLVLR